MTIVSTTFCRAFALVVMLLFVSEQARAMDSTEVLPESVNSPSVRMGIVSGIGMKFMSNGDLMNIGESNSIEFDAATLVRFEPRVEQLVTILNRFGTLKLGNQLSLGVLRVDTMPEVRYVAPVYARGVTSRWTVGFGLPILNYTNKIALRQTGSNLESIRGQVGNASTDLNEAFEKLNVNLATAAQELLVAKGYRPLTDRSETQFGDVQLVSVLQFAKREKSSAQLKSIVSLPTGQGDDPDDLTDLGAFGYTAVENQILGNYILNGRWQVAVKAGYRYTLPDNVVRRVPTEESDTLPDATTKERVRRSTGGAGFAGASLTYSATETLDFGLGFEATRKSGDSYTGDQGTRYDLLSTDTNSGSDRIRIGVTYSTVEKFLGGQAWLPTMIAYEFSDSLRGFNTERMTIHEVWLQLFF